MKGYWITIITPVYNGEKCIEKTINSVIRSKTDEIEYIIIDGQSDDNTRVIIEKYRMVIDYYLSEKDNGIYDALNKGIRNAHGKYIMMLAAGDYLLDGALSIVRSVVSYDIDIFCGAIIHHSDIGYQYIQSEKELEKLYLYCSLRHPASIFKKQQFEKYGLYCPEYRCAGDREIFLRWYSLGAKFQIENIAIVLFESGSGISTANPAKYLIPEDVSISRMYNVPDEMIEEQKKKVMADAFPPLWKKMIRKVLIKTMTYRPLMKILKKSIKFVEKDELIKYGVQGE